MAERAIRSGMIAFGLVSVPIKLYKGSDESDDVTTACAGMSCDLICNAWPAGQAFEFSIRRRAYGQCYATHRWQ